jgi:hypothetical protein
VARPAKAVRTGASTAAKAWEIAGKYEPKIAAAVTAALTQFRGKVSIERIRIYIAAGDLSGLSEYMMGVLGQAALPVVAVLNDAVNEAGTAAAVEINAALAAHGVTVDTQLPFAVNSPLAVAFAGVTPTFVYSPVNPRTIAATHTWQGNLIQQMGDNSRLAVMDTVRAGLIAGKGPRSIAVSVREGIGLTRNQNAAVLSFEADLDKIIARGIGSAESWGIYTPSGIARLKASDPATYRRLNFTADEVANGRRWAKISRAAGTLAFDPKTGIKPSKPIGFVSPPTTQGGESAYRLTPDGKPVDAMSTWRLRDKRFDPLIYENVAASEAVTAARKAGDPKGLERAHARERAAREALAGKKAGMVDAYRNRYLKYRSNTIARTESLRAANLGSFESWRQVVQDAGILRDNEVKRVWTTAGDDRVRETHRMASGQKRGMTEPFIVDGFGMMYPPAGPNCRCTIRMQIQLGGFPANP